MKTYPMEILPAGPFSRLSIHLQNDLSPCPSGFAVRQRFPHAIERIHAVDDHPDPVGRDLFLHPGDVSSSRLDHDYSCFPIRETSAYELVENYTHRGKRADIHPMSRQNG